MIHGQLNDGREIRIYNCIGVVIHDCFLSRACRPSVLLFLLLSFMQCNKNFKDFNYGRTSDLGKEQISLVINEIGDRIGIRNKSGILNVILYLSSRGLKLPTFP